MRNLKLLGPMLLLLMAGYALAADNMPEGVQAHKTDAGTMVLTDSKGMTLYTLDRDADGKSSCSGRCAMNWPALTATTDTAPSADWTVVTRDDGTKMWAYKGKPLYTYAKDMKPGDTTGDGVGKVWHVQRPSESVRRRLLRLSTWSSARSPPSTAPFSFGRSLAHILHVLHPGIPFLPVRGESSPSTRISSTR